jgi:ABC-type uncharacterized transport system fused permease/ATPase subunit
VKKRLPDATIVSIGHRASLAGLHARRLEWKGAGEAASLVAVPATS